MSNVLALSIPFFALIFLGMFARAIGFIREDGALNLSKFAFFVALPPMMFMNIAAGTPEDILNWGFFWRYELATITLFIVTALLARSAFCLTRLESGIFGLNAAYPNYGYMGVPLAIMAFGDAAALPVTLMLLADTIVLLALTAIFVSDDRGGPLKAVGEIGLTLIKNPLMQSAILALLFGASGLKLPLVLDHLFTILAGVAAPVALFALGATLYGQPIRSAAGEITTLSVLKLVVHPLLVSGLFILIPGQGDVWIKVAITSACLPVAANVFMLSQVYGAYSGRTASTILISTLMATLTVPIF
ncbi:MAG TPA: auxin efflux carrier, partial [Alphaproteobacteria bacterium]|nr:auxin efflux carrier [Alphaproteobacteria bacterium]